MAAGTTVALRKALELVKLSEARRKPATEIAKLGAAEPQPTDEQKALEAELAKQGLLGIIEAEKKHAIKRREAAAAAQAAAAASVRATKEAYHQRTKKSTEATNLATALTSVYRTEIRDADSFRDFARATVPRLSATLLAAQEAAEEEQMRQALAVAVAEAQKKLKDEAESAAAEKAAKDARRALQDPCVRCGKKYLDEENVYGACRWHTTRACVEAAHRAVPKLSDAIKYHATEARDRRMLYPLFTCGVDTFGVRDDLVHACCGRLLRVKDNGCWVGLHSTTNHLPDLASVIETRVPTAWEPCSLTNVDAAESLGRNMTNKKWRQAFQDEFVINSALGAVQSDLLRPWRVAEPKFGLIADMDMYTQPATLADTYKADVATCAPLAKKWEMSELFMNSPEIADQLKPVMANFERVERELAWMPKKDREQFDVRLRLAHVRLIELVKKAEEKKEVDASNLKTTLDTLLEDVQKADEEAARKKKAEEARKKTEEEAARKKAEETKKAEEAKKKAKEDAARKKKAEEAKDIKIDELKQIVTDSKIKVTKWFESRQSERTLPPDFADLYERIQMQFNDFIMHVADLEKRPDSRIKTYLQTELVPDISVNVAILTDTNPLRRKPGDPGYEAIRNVKTLVVSSDMPLGYGSIAIESLREFLANHASKFLEKYRLRQISKEARIPKMKRLAHVLDTGEEDPSAIPDDLTL